MSHTMRRVELILYLRQTYSTDHLKRSLGQHLLSVFDRLVALGCDIDICTAGALHSIYGTTNFKTVTMVASNQNRNSVRNKFGLRVERLIFLFHTCSRKSQNNIEKGVLFNRTNRYLLRGVVIDEIRALRLIEAVNYLDQHEEHYVAKKLPNVYKAHKKQQELISHMKASQHDRKEISKIEGKNTYGFCSRIFSCCSSVRMSFLVSRERHRMFQTSRSHSCCGSFGCCFLGRHSFPLSSRNNGMRMLRLRVYPHDECDQNESSNNNNNNCNNNNDNQDN